MITIGKIQDVIVIERNNFGDRSVCGNDLSLAVAAAILIYSASDKENQERLLSEAEDYRRVLFEDCPSLGIVEK